MRRKMLLTAAIVAVVLLLLCVAAVFMMPRGPSLEEYAYLLEPRITTLPGQHMLVVEAKGEPNTIGSDAFGLLFKTYFKLKGVPKGPKQPAPRARWPLSPETPKDQWIGRYAIPVPEDIDVVPHVDADESGLSAALTTWQYGQVAEILHVGPYEKEEPTIRKLMQFIEASDCAIIGEHEEEYLKGPGMFAWGNPDKYMTIIRYRVKTSGDPNDGDQTSERQGQN